MQAPNLQDDKRKEDSLNSTQDDYERKFNDSLSQDDVTKGIQDLENFANKKDGKQIEDAKKPVDQQEEQGNWRNNTSENTAGDSTVRGRVLTKGLGFAKRRGGLIGLLAALGIGGGLLAGVFGPATMVINIMENFTNTNDSMSISLEQRMLKVLGYSTAKPSDSDPICANNTKLTLRCKMGSISSSALKQLEKKGFVAYYDGDLPVDTSKRYPDRNPDGYEYDAGDGKGKQKISAANFTQFLADNPKHAVKVLGPGGALTVVSRAWAGKHITQKFFKPFGLEKKGGLLDGLTKLDGNAQDKMKNTLERLRSKAPDADAVGKGANKIKAKVEGQLGKAKKGGVGYMLAVGSCMAVKAPGIYAAAAAGIQLLPVVGYVQDTILSPGGKMKASGIEGASAVSPESVSGLNTLLTSKSLDVESNKMLSTTDSPHLQAAMGVNTNKVTMSKFTPGYGVLTSSLVKDAGKAEDAMAPACNAIMSPAAMWSAFAVDSAITVAASSTVILGVAKVLIGVGASLIIERAATMVIESVAKDALMALAENKDLATAQGKELGDIIGIGAMAYFSAGAMSRYVPGLKMSQLKGFTALKNETQNFEKQMAVASLSPFDVSSKYTFLGSIVHNVNTAMVVNGGYSGNVFSVLSSVMSIPNTFINPTVGASAEFTETYCGYASEFGLEAIDSNGQPDPANTPAINASGLPCTGITGQQANMSSSEAIDLMVDEGWVDVSDSKTIAPNDSIADLVKKEIIKPETPLADFIESCGTPETGDYIYNASGCTATETAKSTDSVQSGWKDQCGTNGDGETVCIDDLQELDESEGMGLKNPKALPAISVFLIDYQLNASVNGQDEQESAGSTGSAGGVANLVGRPEGAVDEDRGWTLAPGVDYSQYACDPRTPPYNNGAEGVHTISISSRQGPAGAIIRLCKVPFAGNAMTDYNGHDLVSSTISTNIMNMFEAAHAEGVMLQLNDGMRLTFGSNYYSQHTTGLSLDIGVTGANTICRAGADAQNGWGSAEAAQQKCAGFGGVQFAAYTWLQNNAEKYGFYNYLKEPWHWSTSGR